MAYEFGKQIWDGLLADIGNEYGVAGVMGNLRAESGLIPYRLQNDFSEGYANSLTYTQQVDSGVVSESEFVNRELGYGLAQWTYHTRKQGLYDMKQSMGVSIGSVELGIAYLLYELKNDYPGVYSTLKGASSVRQASDSFLHDFESPADQSVSVEEQRASFGVEFYNEYSGSEPITPNNPSTKSKNKGYNFILFNRNRNRSIV